MQFIRACRNAVIAVAIFASESHFACIGNENLFLPGDAFFPSVVTKESLHRFASAPNTHQFTYSKLGKPGGSMAGYAGFERAILDSADADLAYNLRKAYKIYREIEPRMLIEETGEDGKLALTEANGMHVMFYSMAFDFPAYALGLTYNDRWFEEVVSFGHPRRTAKLFCLIDAPEAVASCWKDAAEVPALQVRVPYVSRNPTMKITEPIRIAEDVQIFIPLSGTLTEFWHRGRGSDTKLLLLVVSSKGVKSFAFVNGAWVETQD